MLDVIQFLHILSGTVWAGGAIFFAFVVEPALLKLDPTAIRTHQAALARFAGPLMASSGVMLLLSGVARAWLGQDLSSLADLGSAYVLYAALALVLVVVIAVAGGRYRGRVAALLAADGDPRPQLAALWRRQAVVTGVGILAIIAIMTILGLGLY
jgi:uncharacterized membrane protein